MAAPLKYLGIDVGTKRIGLATATSEVKIASAYKTVALPELSEVLKTDGPFTAVVVGLPRGLDGQDTVQTLAVRRWADDHLGPVDELIIWQDEAGTSALAEDDLKASGRSYDKGDIDSGAAAIILQDYLDSL